MAGVLVSIISAATTLFIILDPLLSTSMFIDLTRGLSGKEVLKQAGIATAVAGALMLVFLVFNDIIFSILNIELESFKVAGGTILFILGLQIVLGLDIGGKVVHGT
ncbi:MAG TPA: MarC family protein, partial [Methanocorpusculum sp.]|nr:MarC family protein [Methanocorpusculum sp.]